MTKTTTPDATTRAAPSASETGEVAAQCAAAIDKLLALTSGGPSGELGAKAAALLAAEIARKLEAEHAQSAGS